MFTFLAIVLILGSAMYGSGLNRSGTIVGDQISPPAPSSHPDGPPVAHPMAVGSIASGPLDQRFFTLTVITNPSFCTVSIDNQQWFNGTSNSSITYGYHSIVANYCPGEALVRWQSTAGPPTGANLSPTYLFVQANGSLTADFAVGYNVTFNETGLVTGTSWTVELDGSNISAPGASIQFQKTNGTFSYSIAPFVDFATKYSGTVRVSGTQVTVLVVFVPIVYEVRFMASGLPSETSWVVTLNNSTTYAKTTQIGFAQLNGTYSYTIWQIPGYHPNVTAGRVTVSGHPQVIYVGFAQNASTSPTLPSWGLYAIVGLVVVVVGVGAAWIFGRRARAPPSGPS